MSKLKTIIGVGLALSILGCNAGPNQTNIELVQAMMDQESIKAQDTDPNNPGKPMMRVPPEGTIPQNYTPYAYKGDLAGAEANLKNPMAGDNTPETLARGKEFYGIYCAVCHGAKGDGKGTVAEKMSLKPPSFLEGPVKDLNDGRIYHTITDGKGLMGSYANQIHKESDRWAIVNYIRNLQSQ